MTMKHTLGWKRLALCLCLASVQVGANAAEKASKHFNIQRQTLATALSQFARQSDRQILFSTEIVATKETGGIRGELMPEDALKQLLQGTGLTFRVTEDNTILVEAPRPGGTARQLSSGGTTWISMLDGAAVQSVGEDKEQSAGKAGVHNAKSGGSVDEMIVEESKIKPYSDANVDIPRTINDHQPYYIFDSETIRQSGAYNVEDFLKQRLSMNTMAFNNGQKAGENILGNTSTINLRGLGMDKTLILINGRRSAGVKTAGGTFYANTDYQPDLNGIPLTAIDRIEVLPSSASGIYGGSAMGGVVNVILKRNYTGGEMRLAYDNTWNTDSPSRTVSGSYGLSLEGGKTHLNFSASWSDSTPLLLQERVGIFKENLATVQRNSPTFIYSSTTPWLGALPNISTIPQYVPVPAGTPGSIGPYAPGTNFGGGPTTTGLPNLLYQAGPLVLKNNQTPLSSSFTYVPAGVSSATSTADLASGLFANRGNWNLGFPESTQAPTGLLRPFGVAPETKSFQASVRREMLPILELFADFSFNENSSQSVRNPLSSSMIIPAAAPTNPFTTNVTIVVPDSGAIPINTHSQAYNVTLGALAKLSGGWTAGLDYTLSENRFAFDLFAHDATAWDADLLNGSLNPFVDTLLYPLNAKKYLVARAYEGTNRLHDMALRGSGPLPSLPWGIPNLTVGLEHRIATTPKRTETSVKPITVSTNSITNIYKRQSVTDSAYLEASIPLVKSGWLPLVRDLNFQLSGRSERYVVDTGTSQEDISYNLVPVRISYTGTTLNGQPYFSRASYSSRNHTLGLKYQPVDGVILRVSNATAFLPPAPAQLIRNPLQSTSTTAVNDPITGQNGVQVYTLSGGNPDLTPQNSKSFNAGLIWEPRWESLSGLRFNAEYYRIEQFDAIGTLSAQQIVSQANTYPDRVTRDANGRITLVDTSSVNLYHRETEGWDISVDYSLKTSVGSFNLHAVESIITGLRNQYSQTQPELETAGYPNEGGAAKYKSNATLSWNSQQWTAGWTARYFGSYKQYGAAGGPNSMQYYNGGVDTYRIIPQGSDTIPSQTYHDLFLSYDFGGKDANALRGGSFVSGLFRGTTVQFGMRNVFNTVPPLDVSYADNYYLSPYEGTRLRSYWLSATKAF